MTVGSAAPVPFSLSKPSCIRWKLLAEATVSGIFSCPPCPSHHRLFVTLTGLSVCMCSLHPAVFCGSTWNESSILWVQYRLVCFLTVWSRWRDAIYL